MKPRITRVCLPHGTCVWSVEVEWHSTLFSIFTSCFALAYCYAGTGELQRRFPEMGQSIAVKNGKEKAKCNK